MASEPIEKLYTPDIQPERTLRRRHHLVYRLSAFLINLIQLLTPPELQHGFFCRLQYIPRFIHIQYIR